MGIVRPVMTEFPYAWVFFVPFILVATFTILNLFIAIIVSTMQSLSEEERREEHAIIEEVVHDESVSLRDEVRALRVEIGELKAALAARK